MKIPPASASTTAASLTASAPKAPAAADDGGVPKLDDLFDGSKPKFSPAYNKYIASTQVPHSIDPKAYYDADADAAEASRYYSQVSTVSDPSKRISALRDLVTQTHKPDPRGYDYDTVGILSTPYAGPC